MVGVYGLGFLTVLIFLWPAIFILQCKRRILVVSIVLFGFIAGCWIFGLVDVWNELPQAVVDASSVKAFQALLTRSSAVPVL